jgi:hypothetical protein
MPDREHAVHLKGLRNDSVASRLGGGHKVAQGPGFGGATSWSLEPSAAEDDS